MSQSLDRALTMLTELAGGPRTLDQLAGTLGVHKSTALRLLRTLESHRFVQRDDVRHYRLGTAMFDLANQALEERDVRRLVEPHLRALNARTGHTVHLASYEDGEVVYIDKYDSRHPVRMYSRIGRRAALHCTAVAKVLVAALPAAERRAIAASIDYPRLTANTITDSQGYLDELERVREQGYAVDNAEHEDFIHCLGAPIRGAGGRVVAAVSLSVPQMLLDFDGLMELLPDLVRTAEAASVECGWTPTPGRVPGTTRKDD
ncbi:transcriptional regulator, IclR family [Streptoalloteichus tenebrarius]|uniref:Transcriptional regulator, IclR family n=1 Tax=Streptoalloteichus tenebrarius (strain ATCC 17920 / DSM 40477 / JCM 4838 / CBS 697.72 / NBRC 16177 / NCIMB 11028 / NRRL B-12390 / A12253. 1 / ISP 5477) TaxID=1933 RepID=A0ABT1HSG7_STRSD|nr:IclR family transcriptional regulator [Streptoalloteichus tenebrarius]MCP2258468.1 transcriptional regulator, IclR family [Streptoalloteichus tenebrarius]BFF03640.1 IclR family transcriptional regulator [Streptoalloteichus tenebrarius]